MVDRKIHYMADNRQQFREAVEGWQQLYRDQAFSLSPDIGSTAIICSGLPYQTPGTDNAEAELGLLRREAFMLADHVRSNNGVAEVAINATVSDMTRLLQDPKVATMYTIANGNLAAINLETPGDYDWRQVAIDATHLKLGVFIQRHCGILSRTFNAPLGLFAVTDPRNVWAPVGEFFNPADLTEPENAKIRRVFSRKKVHYRDVKNLVQGTDITS